MHYRAIKAEEEGWLERRADAATTSKLQTTSTKKKKREKEEEERKKTKRKRGGEYNNNNSEWKNFGRWQFDARCGQGNKISFSFSINKMYVTRPWGPRKKNIATRLKRNTLGTTSSSWLLLPVPSFSAVFSSACDEPLSSRPPPHSAPLPKPQP